MFIIFKVYWMVRCLFFTSIFDTFFYILDFNCFWCIFWLTLVSYFRFLKYFSWRGVRILGGGMNVPDKISSAPFEHPSFPMIPYICLVLTIDPSAWDRWRMFFLMRNFSISFGYVTFFYWIESSFRILFLSSIFTGTCMEDKLDVFGGLKYCSMVDCRSLW